MNLNQVIMGGTLTKDIELRETAGGTAVANFTVVVNKSYKDKNGEKQEKATFTDVKMWGRQAEVVAEYFGKGGQIIVIGELEQETWESDAGKRSKHVINAFKFEFCGKNRGGEQGEHAGAVAAAMDDGDGIPF